MLVSLGRAMLVDAAPSPLPPSEWADAHVPVVYCSISSAPGFDPKDPKVIVTYSNTSDRCPAYEDVASNTRDRMLLCPEVLFDGVPATEIDPELDYSLGVEIEIPPMTAVSMWYRVGDKYRLPAHWSRMQAWARSLNMVGAQWSEFDRSGQMVSNGAIYGYVTFKQNLTNRWQIDSRRARIRTDIQRYAAMRSNGIPWKLRIGTTRTPTGLANPVAWVRIVSNTIPYDRLPRLETHEAPSTVPAPPSGPERVSRPPWLMWVGGIALAVLVWAAVWRRLAQGTPEKKD